MYKVEGFEFEDELEAEEAKKEAEGVRYITEHTDMENPDVVLKLYTKLIEQKLFSTVVGLRFLLELQLNLYRIPYIKSEDVLEIPLKDFERKQREETLCAPKKKVEKRYINRDYKKAFCISFFLMIVFACSIVGMFVITKLSDNNINIINYKNAVINEYEEWEKELEDREKAVEEKEQELEMKENRS